MTHNVVRQKETGISVSRNDTTLRNNTVENNTGSGLFMGGEYAPKNVLVTEFTATENGGNGVSVEGLNDPQNITIRESNISNNDGNGINVTKAGTGPDAVTIEDTTVSGNARNGVRLADGVVDTTLRNVTLRANGADGLDTTGTTNDTLVADSTVDDNGGVAIDARASTNVSGQTVVLDSTTVDFEAAHVNVTGVDPASAPTTPSNRSDVGAFVDADAGSGQSYLDLTVAYEDAAASGLNESTLTFWSYDQASGDWSESGGTADASANTIRYNFTSFSTLAPLAATSPRFGVSIDSTTESVSEGDTIDVTVVVDNTGGSADTQTVTLSTDGSQVDSRSVSLEAGTSETITLSWTTESGDAGERSLSVASANETDSTTVTVGERTVGGDGGNGGGSSFSKSSTQFEPSVANADTVTRLSIEIPSTVVGTVSAAEVDDFPSDVGSPPGTVIAGLEITPPEDAEGGGTVRIAVDRDAVEGDPDDLRLYRHGTDGWNVLDIDSVRTTQSEVVLEAEISDFSYFAVVSDTAATPTSTPAPTVTDSPTVTTSVSAGTGTTTSSSTTTPTASAQTAGDGTGFGSVVALVALVVAVLVGRRR